MPNGKPGDNPITDMLIHGKHPFPSDIEEMIRRIHAINTGILHDLEWKPFDWEQGKNLEEGREELKRLLIEHGE